MGYVFVSYEERDRDFAKGLMLRLKHVGIPVWEQGNITPLPAERYTQIDQAIRNASALIVVMTPAAKASEAVTYEWIFALGAGVSVIPLLLQETSLPSRLVMLSRFDFTNSAMLPWEGFIETLQMTLKETEPHRVFTPHGTPSYIREAIKALDSANPDDREGAIDNLAQSDHPVAIEALVGALSHPLQDVRIFAALARGHAGDTRAIPGLLRTAVDRTVCRDRKTDNPGELAQKKVSTLSHEERVALVERESRELPLTQQAELLSISRSSLYYQPREPSAEEIAIKHRIDEIYTQSPFYGSRKIAARGGRDQSENRATTYAGNGHRGDLSRAEFESAAAQSTRVSLSVTQSHHWCSQSGLGH